MRKEGKRCVFKYAHGGKHVVSACIFNIISRKIYSIEARECEFYLDDFVLRQFIERQL